MFFKLGHLFLVFTCCSGCVFGAGSKTVSKRNQNIPWHEERFHHIGKDLNTSDFNIIARMGDEQHFDDTLTPILITRVVGTPGHTAVREFIVNEMKKLGWTVELHAFDDRTPVGLKTFTNVIATLNPSATRRLVLACHYDSKLTPRGFLGATDSAVPCAMLINLAYTMQNYLRNQKEKRSDLTLQILFIDGEEAFKTWTDTDSLYGSRKLANDLHNTPFPLGGFKDTTQLHRIDLFVLLDLIGTEDCAFFSYFEDSEPWYIKIMEYERRMMKLGLINKRDFMFKNKRRYFAGIADDHIPFLKKGVPVLHLISVPFPSVWHKITDNRRSLHSPSIQNMNALMRAFVADYLHLDLSL